MSMIMGGGSGSGVDTGTAVAAAADNGPSAFVDAVLNIFVTVTNNEVTDEARDSIVERAFVDRYEWTSSLQANRFSPDTIAAILFESLLQAQSLIPGERIREPQLWQALHEIVQERYSCPYPFKHPLC
jgi:hypothetical protein